VAIFLIDPADPIGNAHPFQPRRGDTFDILKATQIKDDGFILLAPELSAGLGFSSAIITGADRTQTLRLTVSYQPPLLSIQTADSQIQITWPLASFPYFALQSATNLANPNWSEVPVSTNSFTLDTAAGPQFFRLISR
jgi:hypothetical protein